MFIEVFKAERKKNYANIKKYPFLLITSGLAFIIFIPLIILLLKLIKLDQNAYMFAFLVTLLLTIKGPIGTYEEDIEKGRFEQIFSGIITIFNLSIIRVLFLITMTLLTSILILIICNFFAHPIGISVIKLFLIMCMFVVFGITIGYIILGLKFKYRKVAGFTDLVILIITVLFFCPFETLNPIIREVILYLVPCGSIIAYVQAQSGSNVFTGYQLYTGMCINFLIYLSLAFFCHRKFYKAARKNGTLGWY